jgi:hypothetical protein
MVTCESRQWVSRRLTDVQTDPAGSEPATPRAESQARSPDRFKVLAHTAHPNQHIATTAGIGKSAWFKDPDGNTLALFQPE